MNDTQILCSCDFDLDPMTFIYELDVDVLKMYLPTKNELSRSVFSNIRALRTQTEYLTTPYWQLVKTWWLTTALC